MNFTIASSLTSFDFVGFLGVRSNELRKLICKYFIIRKLLFLNNKTLFQLSLSHTTKGLRKVSLQTQKLR